MTLELKTSCTFLIGPNGAGKSTLLDLVAQNILPTSGMVYANSISYLPSEFSSDLDLTVNELSSILIGRPPNPEQINAFDISAFLECKLGELSSGERHRVWVTCILSDSSDLLLLDEPLRYLDIKFQKRLMEQISLMRNRHFLIASHDFHWIKEFATSNTILLNQGKIQSQGFTKDVLMSKESSIAFETDIF